MMAIVNGNSSSYEPSIGKSLQFLGTAPAVLGYLAGQVVNYFATVNTFFPLDGGISIPETRLIIDGLSFHLMLCGLLRAVFGSIVILFNPEGYLVTFGTRILPSAIFTTVSLLYDSFPFNALLFAPFCRLRKQATQGSTTHNECLLDKLAPHALHTALCHRHWAAAHSALADFVGTLFPIFIYGLCKFERIPGPLPRTMERADTFDSTWPDSVGHDGGAAVLLTSFEMLNLSFPSLTNEEFALPHLQSST